MRRALIKDDLVVNVIEIDADSDWKTPKGHTLLTEAESESASPGDSWDGQKFTTPPPIPREPSRLDLLEERLAALERPVAT